MNALGTIEVLGVVSLAIVMGGGAASRLIVSVVQAALELAKEAKLKRISIVGVLLGVVSGCEPEPGVRPIEQCRALDVRHPELGAAYAEARSLAFYRYGNGHPFCEATSHVTAHVANTKYGLEAVKIEIMFNDAYRESCGREPEFAWHTVAAVQAGDDFAILDPVYRCGTQSLRDYVRDYVAADCPDFRSFSGCESVTLEQWQSGELPASAVCYTVVLPATAYDVANCGPQPEIRGWEPGRLARAQSWIRPNGSPPSSYEARPDANPMLDFECYYPVGWRAADGALWETPGGRVSEGDQSSAERWCGELSLEGRAMRLPSLEELTQLNASSGSACSVGLPYDAAYPVTRSSTPVSGAPGAYYGFDLGTCEVTPLQGFASGVARCIAR